MELFICKVCMHIEFNEAPDTCPVCGAPKSAFKQNDKVFEEAQANSAEGAVKHIPQITVHKECKLIPEESCVDIAFRIGATLHPVTPEHFIVFADCYIDKKHVERIHFSPSVFPAGAIHLKISGNSVQIVEFCNKHGHWMAETSL